MLNTYYVLVCELDDEYMEVKNLKVLPLTIKIERQFNTNPILHKKKIIKASEILSRKGNYY